MNKTSKKYLKEKCEKHNIIIPEGYGSKRIQTFFENKLREKGFSEAEIREEFSSDWEALTI